MPCYKPVKSTMPASAANFPNATTAPGTSSVWGGPTGQAPVHNSYIAPKNAKHR